MLPGNGALQHVLEYDGILQAIRLLDVYDERIVLGLFISNSNKTIPVHLGRYADIPRTGPARTSPRLCPPISRRDPGLAGEMVRSLHLSGHQTIRSLHLSG